MKSYELRDKMEAWIMFVLILGFIFCCVYYFCFSTSKMPSVSKVVVQVEQLDSLIGSEAYSKEEMDSLIAVVKNYELKLDEKYQYLLEKREDDDRFKTWGALLVGLFVSVLGFFGYKSFKDIKSHCEEIAKLEATTKANEIATRQAETTAALKANEYLEGHIDEKINEAMTAHYNDEATSVLKQRIIDELRPIISDEIGARIRDNQAGPDANNQQQDDHGENNNRQPLF